MNWYLEAWKKYNDFSGRSRRTEFWMFILINCVVSWVLFFIEATFGSPGILSGIYSLVVLVPALAVGVRRLHDTGREGLWILGCFVPILNFVVLYFMALDSTPGANPFGANPKGQ